MDNHQSERSYYIEGGEGTKLYMEETVNLKGRSLLFIQRLNRSQLVWNKQVNSNLSNQFYMITMDNRGHGQSEKSREKYDISKLCADDIRNVIYTLGLEQPVLIGWSYGGTIVAAKSRIGVPQAASETVLVYSLLRSKLTSNDLSQSRYTIDRFIQLCTIRELSPHDLYLFLAITLLSPLLYGKG